MNKTVSSSAAPEVIMRPSDFERIRRMAYEFCGVELAGKQVLVSARLGKKVRELGLSSFEKYYEHVHGDPSGESFTDMIDALTTNHTSFYREPRHFEFLRETILPSLPTGARLQIWSAACSTGEEPYTMAFSLMEAMGDAALSRASITATDISTRVLKKARQGLYPASALVNVPQQILRRCLLKGTGTYADSCLVKPEIREMISFQKLNLLQDCSAVGPFHVIFCRNVMIYFDQKTQQSVVNQLISRLMPGGYLLIGHSESLNGIDHPLKFVRSATYRKTGTFADLRQSRHLPEGVR